jgi:hypothetical protein
MPIYVTGTVISAASLNNREAIRRFLAIGDLHSIIGTKSGGREIDYIVLPAAFDIGAIDMLCPSSAASGNIEIDLLRVTSSGGAATSLYTSNTKPSLTLAGGVSFATFTGANLPNTTSLAAGTVLIVKLVSAPVGCEDLYVTVR